MLEIIDPHVHFFDLAHGKYDWLKSSNPPHWPCKQILQRNFGANDLVLGDTFTLKGLVHIEAGFDNDAPENELAWVSKHTRSIKPILSAKVVGFADLLASPEGFAEQLGRLSKHAEFCGIRYILDEHTLLPVPSKNMMNNFQYLFEQGYLFELQLDLNNKPAAAVMLGLLQSFPDARIILNHLGFTHQRLCLNSRSIQDSGDPESQKDALNAFAVLNNCWVKVSGFEMSNPHYDYQDMCNSYRAISDVFSADRILAASNFPVSNLACSYQQYWEMTYAAVTDCGLVFNDIASRNAQQAYGFSI